MQEKEASNNSGEKSIRIRRRMVVSAYQIYEEEENLETLELFFVRRRNESDRLQWFMNK